MRHCILYILLAFLAMACQKESEITPGIGFENLYAIEDDPTDSVQHKRYEIYEAYGVPVYFNDTIGKVFVKVDVDGDSVFHYETLDLNWAFDGTNSGSVTYKMTRIDDPTLQMKALRFAEIYLENSQPALHPYAMWLTKECYALSSDGVDEVELVARYRNLMFSWIEDIEEEDMKGVAVEHRNEVVKLKVQNYSERLKAFNNATDEKYYNQNWADLYPEEILPVYYSTKPVWYPSPLKEVWEQDSSFRKSMKKNGQYTNPDWPQGVWTDEIVDQYIEHCRDLVGAYGFIGYKLKGSTNIKFTPGNTEDDLEQYLQEMMLYPRKEFLERWATSPQVLKKYEILYAIILEELGVEL